VEETGDDGRPSRLNRRPSLPITRAMPIEAALEHISAIRQAMADPASLVGSGRVRSGAEAPAAGGAAFASALAQAGSGSASPAGAGTGMLAAGGSSGLAAEGGPSSLYALQGVGTVPGSPYAGGGAGGRIVAVAESQLGQAEQPPGSNESQAIAEYRSAVAGSAPGEPWCAYFASWAARQAGEPIGPGGQGLGSVSEIWSWAQSTGRALPNGPSVRPEPGDLIVFGGEHVGIVRGVLPDGRIQTIEGNYENKVAANVRSASEATGYVRM
jgi:CHAP domain